MTDETFFGALRTLAALFRDRGAKPLRNRAARALSDRYDHLLFMCEYAEELARAGRTHKAHRWLGFVQGALWMADVTSIDELRRLNKPEPP